MVTLGTDSVWTISLIESLISDTADLQDGMSLQFDTVSNFCL